MMTDGAAVHELVESQFAHVRQALFSKSLLRNSLQQLVPVMAGAAPEDLPGAPAVLLAQSLALVTGADASRSVAALAALRNLDPVGDVTAAWHRRNQAAAAPSPDQLDAWRVAMELVSTPIGTDVLQTIIGKRVAPQQEGNFRLLLKTASAIAERDKTSATPASMLARATPPSTLLDHALTCAAARLAGDVRAAQPNDWALNAVRNDLFDTGPGSDFAAIEARLMKMGKWVDRAAGKKRQSFYNPFRGKSAFRALRHGVQQVDRGPAISRHRKAFDAALRSAATQLRDQLVQMAPFANAGGPAQVPRELFRAAVLDHCVAAADTLLDGRQFDSTAIDDIAARLAGFLNQAGSQPANGTPEVLLKQLKRLPEFQALASTPMTMEELEAWLGDALKTHAALPQAWAEPRPVWADAIVDDLQRAHVEVHGHDTRMPRVSREGLRSALKHVVQNIEGSRLKLTSGGIVGVGLRQVSAAVSSLLSGFMFRGRIDTRRQWGRQAVFEIAMPPYDMEITIATQRQRTMQLGAGAFFGPDLGIAKAGANVDITGYGSESADLQGVTLRLPRLGRPVNEVRAEFSRVIDRLLDGTDPELRDTRQPLLKQLLQEFPELTVNRIGRAGDERKRHAATGEGVASVSCFGFRANASAGATIEGQHGVNRHYQDACGSMQVERHIAGWGVRGAVGARLTAGPGANAGPVELASGNTDTVIAGISADLLVAGGSERREVVYENGRLHPLSFKETEFQNLDGFLAHMKTRREQWVQARLAAPAEARTVDTEHATLQKFLDEVTEQDAPTHTYVDRSGITREAAARIDAYRSAGMLAERQVARADNGVGPTAREVLTSLNAAAEDEWLKPESMRPCALRAYERVSTQSIAGVNVVAQVGALYAAEANHINNRLDAA